MAQKKVKQKDRQIGKKQPEKKHLINPKYKNTFWTIVVLLILLIFFIVNNTRTVAKQGPYPPGYDSQKMEKPTTVVDKRLQMDTHIKKTN
ncbi:MAG: hypothetical protein ACYDEE_15435 [Ignavibacteriaceae bacterium]|jgi:hypothetical protein